MKLLLHTCCAPCAIHPVKAFNGEGLSDITAFFYNPNIHPYSEYLNRKKAVEEYSDRYKIPAIFHKYDIENYFRRISGNESSGTRCSLCWRMRLEETALFAAKNGYGAFSTTLLVSPYQDQGAVKRIGAQEAQRHGVRFLARDFRDGFRPAQEEARCANLYRQKYCGCIFSEKERFEKI